MGIDKRLLESQEVKWLALNIWHEARGEPYACQRMVAEVTMRRVDSKYYPNTMERVVMQPYQFSWTISNKPDFSVLSDEVLATAYDALHEGYFYTTNELHYARTDVDNYWTKKMSPPTLICGWHAFYDNGGRP